MCCFQNSEIFFYMFFSFFEYYTSVKGYYVVLKMLEKSHGFDAFLTDRNTFLKYKTTSIWSKNPPIFMGAIAFFKHFFAKCLIRSNTVWKLTCFELHLLKRSMEYICVVGYKILSVSQRPISFPPSRPNHTNTMMTDHFMLSGDI